MEPADALSRKDEIETCDDNWEITLLKGKDQYFHICTIDAALTKKISSSSSFEDPIVTKALTAMKNESGKPWIPRTVAADWKFIDNTLYFKHYLYIPEPAHHDLVKSLHESPARDMKGSSEPFIECKETIGGPGCLPSFGGSSRDVLTAKQPR